ncbi:UDP-GLYCOSYLTRANSFERASE 75D1 [Salix purpurea]|uniref:UDP-GLYCOSYLTRANSFERASE 75D1 n=1 Tax=Salix purpurea TaxID=77065 RepID=A0A9Q0VWY9_SALPP|nr:UDP-GLYCOSYLTRANSFERASE 75D1 [Salix purpurea]
MMVPSMGSDPAMISTTTSPSSGVLARNLSLTLYVKVRKMADHSLVWCTPISYPGWRKVARQLNLPSTLLWNQSPALLDIFYYYFNGYGDTIKKNINDPGFSLKLPGLPPLESRDLPSFLNPRNTHAFALPVNKEHIEVLDEETSPKVLVNTFDALEWEALNSIGKFKLVGVGPLIPSAFLDGKDPTDTSFGGDLFQDSKDYTEWLNAKPESSVIYISFGSISVVSKPQKEEMARALLDTGRPFLWVIRADGGEEKEEDKLSCREELEKQGKIKNLNLYILE